MVKTGEGRLIVPLRTAGYGNFNGASLSWFDAFLTSPVEKVVEFRASCDSIRLGVNERKTIPAGVCVIRLALHHRGKHHRLTLL